MVFLTLSVGKFCAFCALLRQFIRAGKMANAPELSGASVVSHGINSGSRVERAEILAGAVVGAFEALRAERRPTAGTENFRLLHVVHINRNPQHRRERNQIRADVSVADSTVISTPVVHHRIDISERPVTRQTRRKPGGRPGRIRALIQRVVNFVRQINRETLGDLQRGSESFDEI